MDIYALSMDNPQISTDFQIMCVFFLFRSGLLMEVERELIRRIAIIFGAHLFRFHDCSVFELFQFSTNQITFEGGEAARGNRANHTEGFSDFRGEKGPITLRSFTFD